MSAFFFCSSAFTFASTATIDELGVVNADTVMLRAQAARESARRALQQARRSAEFSACTHAVSHTIELPRARRIMASNGVREATLVYSDRQIEVREGDALAGGYVVARILPHAWRVDLKSKAGRVVQIPLAGAAHMPVAPNMPAVPLPQPPALFDRPPVGTPSAEQRP